MVNGDSDRGDEMTSKYHKSSKCPICGCSIMVRKLKGLRASLSRALAVASHVKVLHAGNLR